MDVFIRQDPSKMDDDWGYPYDLGNPQCFTSPKYWAYNLQALLKSNVQSPQNETFTKACVGDVSAAIMMIGILFYNPITIWY